MPDQRLRSVDFVHPCFGRLLLLVKVHFNTCNYIAHPVLLFTDQNSLVVPYEDTWGLLVSGESAFGSFSSLFQNPSLLLESKD